MILSPDKLDEESHFEKRSFTSFRMTYDFMTQQEAFDILKLGHNVFLTGSAGSGKTYLLNQYIDYLRLYKVPVGITASTGIAATHIGGTTIHSWSGMGIKDSLDERELADLLKRSYLRNRFAHTKVLIIDEISMLHNYRLDMVNKICQTFLKNRNPFGGMQLIMCGDFFQLPPVTRIEPKKSVILERSDNGAIESHESGNEILSRSLPLQDDKNSEFVYNSKVWDEMNLQVCYIDEQYRQSDKTFLRVLNDIRRNDVNEMTVEALSERLDKQVEGYTRPTRLFTHNKDVDAINKQHLEELNGQPHEYFMSWRGSLGLTEILKKSCLAPEVLTLKKGAQVMFVKNNYEVGYVNGTLGEVIDFDKDDHPIVRTFDGNELVVKQASWEVKEPGTSLHPASQDQVVAAISQFPLRLAWAITVHKSQGMSLDAAEVDLSRSFVPGMGYVALSRVRSLSGLRLMGMNQMALQVNPQVAEMDKEFMRRSDEGVEYLAGMKKEQKEKRQKEFLEYLKK